MTFPKPIDEQGVIQLQEGSFSCVRLGGICCSLPHSARKCFVLGPRPMFSLQAAR